MKPSALVAAAMTVSLLSIAGCSDDPEPRIADPSPSLAPSASEAPTTTPVPELPRAAEGTNAAAAKSLVRFYFDLVNYAQTSGKAEVTTQIVNPNCSACAGGTEALAAIFDAGGQIEGGDVRVVGLDAASVRGGLIRGFTVTATTETSPQVIRIPGDGPTRYEGGPGKYEFIVERFQGSLRVLRWQRADA
ncbi:DUF6318 family protein [Nocardioides sp. Leaf307]|uniref:DUF6318 family protein n=1 Tax=Nocardioides sp. Leaf307 TaxID=1736331 RepID=UPI0012EADA14|nr:DUF6318 family protein [Nocardioides sp. Leaf307]